MIIFLSLLGHAASFYVLQVAYTPTGSLLPPPARVVLVPLDRPENASLARWLALSDPTLATQAPLPAAGAVIDALGFHYQPSYEVNPPAFKSLDAAAPAEGLATPPRPLPPRPVAITEPAPAKSTPVGSGQQTPTRVVLSGGIEGLATAPLPPVAFKGGPGLNPLEPTVFLVGVRVQGGPPFLFPVRRAPSDNPSTNVDEADEFARDYLARLTFRSLGTAGDGTVWGRATFYWGQ